MPVNPLHVNPNSVQQQTDAKSVDGNANARSSGETPRPDGGPGDSVQLSADSMRLSEQAAVGEERPPSGTLSAERLSTIAGRLSSGHYDQASVQDTIANRVASDL